MNAPPSFRRLALRPKKELEAVFLAGRAPSFDELAGKEFLGYNPPWFTQLAGIGKFIKGFLAADDASLPPFVVRAVAGEGASRPGAVAAARGSEGSDPRLLGAGYNRPVARSRLEAPWVPADAGPGARFGWYAVRAVDPAERDGRYPQALLLDYGRGGNPRFDVTRVLRDYLTRIDFGPETVYLGKAYLALGPVRVFSNFFLLCEPEGSAPGMVVP